MKIALIISIFILVFGSSGYYLYIRLAQAFSGTFVTSKIALAIYVFLISSFLIGKIIEHASIGVLSNTLVSIGSFALGFFLYAVMLIVLFDFIRLINHFIPFYPAFITVDYQKTKMILGLISVGIVTSIFFIGYFNARTPKVKNLEMVINKTAADFKELNIVAVSDIHLGTMVNKSKTKRLIAKINELDPDLVIIAGDIIDDNIEVVKYYHLLEYFKELKPKYGVYSCLGNHEYISRAHNELDLFEQNGIQMLKDTTVFVNKQFYIIGRDDVQGKIVSGVERKSLDDLTKDIDFNYPVILLDHQPYKLNETTEFAIDFQFSGHTHNGQIWPANYITGLLFEQDWGYLKKKNTHFYISSGFGTSAMPIRVGNDSEIVHIQLRNEIKKQ